MTNETEPGFSFVEAAAIYQSKAGSLFREPSLERSIFHRGAWLLFDEQGLACICNQRDCVFASNLSAHFMQLAESFAH